jgi:transcriptional regulator with XRE-family HTH domain
MKADERVARQVGRALRRLRLDQDFLMKQVAGRSGITVSMLSLYEHGHRCPSLPNLVKILRALDCTAEEFGNCLGPWGCLP